MIKNGVLLYEDSHFDENNKFILEDTINYTRNF